MFLWISVMQALVDTYLFHIPFNSIAEMYHAHIWTLPWMMLRCFMSTFFYDVLFEIVRILESPYGNHCDCLNLDPILVAAERVSFFNCGHQEAHDMPEFLKDMWLSTKDKKEKDDDDEKKEKKDKKDKKEKNEDKDKIKGEDKISGDAGNKQERCVVVEKIES